MHRMFSRNTLILIVVGVIVAGAVWYGFSGSSAGSTILTTQAADASSNPAQQDLVSTLLTLRAVSLSGTIFSDPSFRGLKDFSTQIVSEPMGRPDPFAPLPSSVTAAAAAANIGNAKLFKAVNQ